MLALLLAVAQSTPEIGEEIASDSGAVGVIGFVIVGFLGVIGAVIYRRRHG